MAKKKRRKCHAACANRTCDKIPSEQSSVIKSVSMESNFKRTFQLKMFTIRLILLVFSAMIYANSLRCGFVYDDRRAILENRNVAHGGEWSQLLRDDFWGTPVSHSGSHKSYRPLVTMTYRLQVQLENLFRHSVSKFKSMSFAGKQENDTRDSFQDAKVANVLSASGEASEHDNIGNKSKDQLANGHTQWQAADASESFGNVREPNAFAYHFVNLLLHLCVVDLVFELYCTLWLSLSHGPQRQRYGATTTRKICKQITVCSKPETAPAASAALSRNRKQQRTATVTASTDASLQMSTTTTENSCDKSNTMSKTTTLKCITGAFLFASHPIHVESVTSLVGRAELMAALFGLMSFRSMLKRLQCAGDNNSASNNRRHLFRSICYALLACLSKENSLMVIVINAILVIWSAHRNRASGSSGQTKVNGMDWRALGAMLAATNAFVCIRLAVLCKGGNLLGSYLPKFYHGDNPLALGASEFCKTHQNLVQAVIGNHADCADSSVLQRVRHHMLLTRIYLPAFNLKLLLWPSELSYDWPLSSIGLVKSVLETRFLLAVGIYALLICYLSSFMLRLSSTAVTELRSVLISFYRNESCGYWIGRKQPIKSDESNIPERDTRTPDSGYCDSISGEQRPKGVVSDINGDITVMETTHEDDAGSCCSGDETNSVDSMDTSKCSNDSGYTDYSLSQVDQNASLSDDKQTQKTAQQLEPPSSLSSYCYQRKILSGLDNLPERNKMTTKNGDEQISDKDYRNAAVKRRSSSRRTSSGPSQVTSPSATADSTFRGIKSDSGSNNDVDLICWSLIWLILPYLPASNMLVSVGFLAAERTLYLPSFGLCLLVAHLIDAMLTRTGNAIFHPDDPNNGYIHNRIIFFCRKITCQQQQQSAAPNLPQRREGKSHALSDSDITNINKQTSETSESEQSLPVGRICAIKLALIMPLILLGALRTIQRNGDWLNERTLYNSNVLQSPAKSMANLATIGHPEPYSDASEYSVVEMYRKALDLEPHSADLHYNLALALHRQLDRRGSATTTAAEHAADIKVTADGSGRQMQNGEDPIEYHYKTAIRLRANFPMAALSLGAYQWLHLGQLAEAEQTFVNDCATGMDASKSKTYQWFVQTQIECLISAAKLYAAVPDTIRSDGYSDRRGERKTNIDAAVEQTNSNNNNNINKQDESADLSAAGLGCPLRVIEWMQSARAKAHQIDAAGQSQPHSFGDLNKQLASINWLEVRCSLKQSARAVAPGAVEDEQAKQQQKQRLAGLLAEAVERYAWSSRSPVESAIYIDYAKTLVGAFPARAPEAENVMRHSFDVMRHSFDVELAKMTRPGYRPSERQVEHLMALVRYLWKRFSAGASLDKAERLVSRLSGSELMFERLTLAAEIALDMGDSSKSELHYKRALEQSQAEVNEKIQVNGKTRTAQSKRLARAHVNYGAILQINGKLTEARDEYVRAIGWDHSNTIAMRNLASTKRKVSAPH